jgi:hypothetical protein
MSASLCPQPDLICIGNIYILLGAYQRVVVAVVIVIIVTIRHANAADSTSNDGNSIPATT